MANAWYAKGKQHLLDGDIDISVDTIKAALIDGADYTPNLSTDDAFDDIPGAAVVATGTLTSKTTTDGVFDADDLTLTTVTGDESELIAIYKDSGVAATSWLMLLIDTATGLPVLPNGGDILIQWDSGANKIAKL